MEFSFEGNKVVCSRLCEKDGGSALHDVVEFDAHVDTVPAHVAARLSASETRELELFLADKRRLQAKSDHRVILEALPGLIDRVRGVLDSTCQIDKSLHEQLNEANRRLGVALSEVAIISEEFGSPLKSMGKSEALKKRLDIIKHRL